MGYTKPMSAVDFDGSHPSKYPSLPVVGGRKLSTPVEVTKLSKKYIKIGLQEDSEGATMFKEAFNSGCYVTLAVGEKVHTGMKVTHVRMIDQGFIEFSLHCVRGCIS